ncbi:hypothetical protein AAG570_010095 [Ranatra chinensis]|uniref:phytanoyl-CoA dioxygenase n=1 Tax=Ranatra chinensis TaxID=642074 RepID=A0ABD0YLJ1_9HEMI
MTLMKDISYVGATPANHRPHQYVYNKLQDIVWDQVLAKYFLYPKLLDVVENFTGPNIMAMHSMLINKPPDAGTLSSTHPLHQDLHYFAFRPADWIVAAWTAMERIDEENGCLKVIPGTHKGHLLPHEYPEMGGIYNKAFFEAKGYVGDKKPIPVIMDKGDTVFFHPLLIHGSGPNLSKRFRKAISCHYAASECYYVDIRGTSQQNAIDEITDGAKRRGILLDMEVKLRNSFCIRALIT